MVFSSPTFLFAFLPLFFLLYYLARNIQYKNVVLLIFSLLFYTWGEGQVAFFMVLSIIVNFLLGLWMAKRQEIKKAILTIGIIFNLSLLFVFKYLGFFDVFLNDLGAKVSLPEIALPIGISFYTFQAMSYIIDVYKQPEWCQRNVLKLGLYISMFPQLVAGPIVRYTTIMEEIDHRSIKLEYFVQGSKRFIIGLIKKVFLANQIAVYADKIIGTDPSYLGPGAAWLGIIAYGLQIYFDFSGYSDMAIGMGKMTGFNFDENFNFPYISRSIKEFWRRWHISLSTWFRDYLYIPLGGNRVSPVRVYLNLTIVFFLTGLWHGASYNFVFWGLLHGVFLIIERLGFEKFLQKMPPVVGHVYTLFVVTVTWVFFRIEDWANAWSYMSALFSLKTLDAPYYTLKYFLDVKLIFLLLVSFLMASSLLTKPYQKLTLSGSRFLKLVDPAFHLMLLFICILLVSSNTFNPFIYFRF